MNSKYVKAKLDFLDSLFHDFETLAMDDYLRSHLAKYLTVLISGIYEDAIKNFIIELAQRRDISKELKEYILNQVDLSFKNPNSENVFKFLKKFSAEWAENFKIKTTQTQREALDAVVSNKNLIAHGDSSEITFADIEQHYQNSKEVLNYLDNLILHINN